MKNKLTLTASAMMLTAALFGDGRSMSLNSEVKVLPAPGKVTIDGKTDDWDLSAGVWSYNDPTIVDDYSVWTHLMWDDKGIYFLARYHDTSPLQNAAAGKDFQQSWRADCFQGRVIFDDGADDEHQMHVNMYYATPDEKPLMIIHHGGFKDKPPYDATGPQRPDQLEKWTSTMDKSGGKIVIAPWPDNKGYNMEAFWPWSYCRTSGQPLKPGESFTFGIEAMWGNADGTMLAHRLADGIKDDTVNRIFMFRARNGWGKATIRKEGNLDITEEQIALQKVRLKQFQDYDTYGSVPIAYEIPEKRDVTIAIDDANGLRVRNLFGQYPRDAGKVVDNWDCLDDAGNPVKPGNYKATVLHHKPIELKFFNSCYSSATPPWPTETGTKLWGSNHGYPTSVATRGDVTVLYFTGTEGGSGIQRIDDKGILQWTDGNEFLDGTIDDTYAYGLSKSSWQDSTLLFRFKLTDGHLTPFDDGKRTPSPKLLPDVLISVNSSLALAHGYLWACMPERILLQINPTTGEIEKEHPIEEMAAVTDRDNELYVLYNDGTVSLLNSKLKAKKLFKAEGIKQPTRLSISEDKARFAISDIGNNQVVVVNDKGKVLSKIGRAWEGNDRPAGKFVKTDLVQPMGTGFDHLGRLWVPEGVKSCKRVTCWSKDYQLLDQYWGQADYGAMAGFPITFDDTRFVAHGIEFKLDPDPKPLVRKTDEQPLYYHPELKNQRGLIYKYKGNEYACGTPGYNKPNDICIFKRDKNEIFQMVVNIELAGRKLENGKWINSLGTAWTDLNENGKEDAGEVTKDLDIRSFYWSNGWIRPDLVLITTGGKRFDPIKFTAGGVPVYDFTKPKMVKNWINAANGQGSCGTPVMDMKGNVSNGIVYHTVDGRKGEYPNPYGRHDAPAAQRGLLIAPFRSNGVVEDIPGIGSMTALGGDRGEWFLMSMDGLYVSSICQDSKANVTLDDTFIGQESFGGFIWKDTNSKNILIQLGGPSYRLMKVENLDTCVKETMNLNISNEDIKKGMAIVQGRQQEAVAEPDSIKIAKIRSVPTTPPAVAQASNIPLIKGATDFKVAERGNPARWFRASIAHNNRDLVIAYQVTDKTPWKNGSGQFTHAFIGGDCVDLQLDVPGRGPIRLLAANVGGEDTVVYWQSKAEEKENPMTYMVANNKANATTFDVVKRLTDTKLQVNKGPSGYTVLITVPLKDLGLENMDDKEIKGVIGVIFSDPSGKNRAARIYWHNKNTGLVSDVPSEARLDVKNWGPVFIEK